MYAKPILQFFKRENGSYVVSIGLFEIFFAVGIGACLLLANYLLRKKIEDKKIVRVFNDLAMLSIIAGYFSAILFQGLYNLIATGEFGTGMTFMGGLIGGAIVFLGGLYFMLPKSFSKLVPQLAEITAPCIAIAHAFGRIGCFFGGCCYGVQTDSFLGVHFQGVAGKVLPTNLFEAIFLFILAIVLIVLVLKDIKLSMLTYLFSYGAFRFIIEFWRGDYRGTLLPFLSPSQWWSIVMLAGAIVVLFFKNRQKKTHEAD